MLSDSTWRLMQEVDNLLIAYFLDGTAEVGIYDASYTLTKSMLIYLWTFQFLFLPIFSSMFENSQDQKMGEFFSVMTKWLISLALPTAVVLIFYPQLAIEMVFGTKYAESGTTLVILTAGFFGFVATGLNRHAITAIGDTRSIFYVSVVALILGILLNIALIPMFGIAGAAGATSISFIAGNLLLAGLLYRQTGIHPLTRPLGSSVVVAAVLTIGFNIVIQPAIYNSARLLMVAVTTLIISLSSFYMLGSNEADKTVFREISN
jgi:O-antigen/teichoic acid export membrane protein